MISTVIFDMDGVIIDSEPVHFSIEQEIFKELGLDISWEEHANYVGRSDLWSCIIENYDLDYEADELLKRDLDRYLSYLESSYDEGPVEGVVDLIKKLFAEGKTLILASSSTMETIHIVLNMFSISDYFAHKISGAELESSKPDPEIFLKAAKKAGVDVKNCLVIEDSKNGVRAAKAAGMTCVGFRNLNSGNQNLEEADFLINNFREFDLDHFSH